MSCAHVIPPATEQHLGQRVQRDLYELALELRRVPVDETSRRVHVRALELKRELMRAGVDENALRRTRDEIARLRAESICLRRQLLTGRQAHAASLVPQATTPFHDNDERVTETLPKGPS